MPQLRVGLQLISLDGLDVSSMPFTRIVTRITALKAGAEVENASRFQALCSTQLLNFARELLIRDAAK